MATKAVRTAPEIRFGPFEVDLQAGELRKSGVKLKLRGQPFQVLTILLERPGEVVTREELQKRLWPDTFVDVDHNLNTSINKIREVLGDSAETPRFVETLPRRGYRFIASVEAMTNGEKGNEDPSKETPPPDRKRLTLVLSAFGACALLAGASWLGYKALNARLPASPVQRPLTRLTYDDGLQTGATWSPDGRFIAYSSDRGGKFDIWMQQISGGDPIQITRGSAQNWQPDWSPDGKYIAYRSEEGEGGIYIIPALGGAGLQRKIASFGYFPRWSPDSSQILFQTDSLEITLFNKSYVVNLDGGPPREVLTETLAKYYVASSAWHPDGRRISAWICNNDSAPALLTEPIEGGRAIKTVIPPEIQKQIDALGPGPAISEWRSDVKFVWAPSGRAIYFERTFRGARNVFRMTIDPATLRATGVERLTAGPGLDAEFSLSPDGSKLAFTNESHNIRAWMFPFDATHGRVTVPGKPITSMGIEAWALGLSQDGTKLAVSGNRGGHPETWETSVLNGREEPITPNDSYWRNPPTWSPDGKRAAYLRFNNSSQQGQIVEWSSESHDEKPIATWNSPNEAVFDWSPDGSSLLVSKWVDNSRVEIWQLPLAASPHAEAEARRITFKQGYFLFQEKFSRDGRWIVFEAVTGQPPQGESVIYAMTSAGGPWIRITDGKQWDDKPRWSPDGKTIYFLSDRKVFFNVWGQHFDPTKGIPQGEPFRVTSFDNPSLMIPRNIQSVDISLSEDRLVLPLAQVSGSIWVLDNVDR